MPRRTKVTGSIRPKSLPPLREDLNQLKDINAPTAGKKKHRKHGKKKKGKLLDSKNEINIVGKTSNRSNTKSLTREFSTLSLDNRKENKTIKHNVPKQSTNFRRNSSSSSNNFTSLSDIAKYILSGGAKNIIVMAGAGISTGSGIPDFRTRGTGLYDNLQKYKIPNPTAIFDMDYFRENPKPFFELAKELYPSTKYKPSNAHYFVRMLHEKGLLLRMYTQNIDGLERVCGIPSEKLVEAHGTFATAACVRCGKRHNGKEIRNKVLRGAVPRCQATDLCWGVVKPDIVFFGEDLPSRFYYYLKDFPICDLLLIMGTSLEVEPFASLTESVRKNTVRVLLNREKVGPFKKRSNTFRDIAVTGDLKDLIQKFAVELKWDEDLNRIIEDNEKILMAANDSEEESSADSGISTSSSPAKIKPTTKPDLTNVRTSQKRFIHFHSTPNSTKTSQPTNTSYYDYVRNHAKKNQKPPFKIEVRSFGEVPLIHYTKKCNSSSASSSDSSSDDTDSSTSSDD